MGAKVGNIGGGMVELFTADISYDSGYGVFRRIFTTNELNNLITACEQYDLITLEFIDSYRKTIESETMSANALLKAFTENLKVYGGMLNYNTDRMSGQWRIGMHQNGATFTPCVEWVTYSDDGTVSFKIYGIKL